MKRFYIIIEKHPILLVYLPLAIHWVIILTLSSIPGNDYVPTFKLGDKVDHFAAFFVLSIFLYLTINVQKKPLFLKKNPEFWTVVIGMCYGILDELHQIFIPGRYCDFLDLLADLLGVLIGLLFVRKFIIKGKPFRRDMNTGTKSM